MQILRQLVRLAPPDNLDISNVLYRSLRNTCISDHHNDVNCVRIKPHCSMVCVLLCITIIHCA